MGAAPEVAAAPSPPSAVVVRRLGRLDYGDALRLQESVHAEVTSDVAPGTILVVEHDPVYTLGRGADEADLLTAPQRLGVPVFRIGRGGGATFHGPGQVVAYPIVRLPGHGRDVERYIRCLERALIATCAVFGIEADTMEGQTGVWTAAGKIAAIGIGVKRGVSMHGVALNVSNSLDYFESIVPCRMPGMRVTTMARELGSGPVRERVEDALVDALCRELSLVPVGSSS